MDSSTPSPFVIARAEIDCWRGRCLDIFAKAERAVATTLEAAILEGRKVRLQHLAGQRLDDLRALMMSEQASEKQKSSLQKAIDDWIELDTSGSFLAHGVATELLDKAGVWTVRFDLTTYRSNVAFPASITLSKVETDDLEAKLNLRFNALSTQVGQLRRRLRSN